MEPRYPYNRAEKMINQNKNYIFHEIIDLNVKKKLFPKDIEIVEDLNKIHEIKELGNNKYNNNSQTYNQPLRKKKFFLKI